MTIIRMLSVLSITMITIADKNDSDNHCRHNGTGIHCFNNDNDNNKLNKNDKINDNITYNNNNDNNNKYNNGDCWQ